MSESSVTWRSDDELRKQGFSIREGGRKVGSGRVTVAGDTSTELQFATHDDRRAMIAAASTAEESTDQRLHSGAFLQEKAYDQSNGE